MDSCLDIQDIVEKLDLRDSPSKELFEVQDPAYSACLKEYGQDFQDLSPPNF